MSTLEDSGTTVEQSDLRLKSTPTVAQEPLARLSLFLTRQPSLPEISRFLVLSMPLPDVATGCMLMRCLDDTFTELVGSFGYPTEVTDVWKRLSIFDRTPFTDAARELRPVIDTDTQLLSRFLPHLPPQSTEGTLLAIPLVSDSGSVGVLTMTFMGKVAKNSSSIRAVQALSSLITVYLVMSKPATVSPMLNPSATHWAAVDIIGVTGVRVGLTKRQMRVLWMLSRKLSNPQIATALDYSVSTIRLDTMVIYRFFGVTSRREAVEEATRRGILHSPTE
jgi:DNA-binding CsgD family transcriptional regulator